MNKYYRQGKKAKELLNINKNQYLKGTYEWEQWELGFKEGIYEPLTYEFELTGELPEYMKI